MAFFYPIHATYAALVKHLREPLGARRYMRLAYRSNWDCLLVIDCDPTYACNALRLPRAPLGDTVLLDLYHLGPNPEKFATTALLPVPVRANFDTISDITFTFQEVAGTRQGGSGNPQNCTLVVQSMKLYDAGASVAVSGGSSSLVSGVAASVHAVGGVPFLQVSQSVRYAIRVSDLRGRALWSVPASEYAPGLYPITAERAGAVSGPLVVSIRGERGVSHQVLLLQ